MMAVPPAGTLRVIRAAPNPRGAPDTELFLVAGDATQPVHALVPAEGVRLPARASHLDTHPFRLRILHWNDLHAHIAHLADSHEAPLLSRIVMEVTRCRAAVAGDLHAAVIALSVGDDMVGTPFDELMSGDGDPFHPAYRLYSEAGLDVDALGNHEFDPGTRALAGMIVRQARFPLLCANLVNPHELAGVVFPAALLVTRGVRIGIVGLVTPAEIVRRDHPDLGIAHPVTATRYLIPLLRPHCDLMIVLSHLGHSLATKTAVTSVAGDVELAQNLPAGSVDLIVGAHTHTALNAAGLATANVVNGIPIVQAGAFGEYLGQVDLTLGSRVLVANVRLLATADLPADEAFEREHVQPLVVRLRPLLERRLGRWSPEIDPELGSGLDVRESPLANFAADALVARCRAAGHAVDFAMIDSSCMDGPQPAGDDLLFQDCYQLMPHADIVGISEITARQLGELLDDNARRAPRTDDPAEERGWLQFSRELRYTIDQAGRRADARAVDARLNGAPPAEWAGRVFRVACTSFVRRSCAEWENRARELGMPIFELCDLPCEYTELSLRGAVVDHIHEQDGITREGGARRDGRVAFR